MPKIPTYDSTGSLSTESPKAKVNPNQMTGFGEGVEAVGEGLAGLGEHFQKLRDVQEVDSTKDRTSLAWSKESDKILKDPKIWDQPEKMDEMINNLKLESTAGIHSGEAREKYNDWATGFFDSKRAELMTQIRNNQSNLVKGTFTQRLDTLSREYETALPHRQEIIKKEIQATANEYKGLGAVHHINTDELVKHTLDSLGVRKLQKDLRTAKDSGSPQMVDAIEKELKKGENGEYKDVPPAKVDSMFKAIEQAKKGSEKQAAKQQKETWLKNKNDMLERFNLNPKSISQDEILSKMVRGTIDQPFAKSMLKNIQAPAAIDAKTDSKTFMDMAEMVADPSIDTDKTRLAILDANTAGKLSYADMKKLYELNIFPTGDDKWTSLTKVMSEDDLKSDLGKANRGAFFNGIRDLRKEASKIGSEAGEVGSSMIGQLLQMIHKGEVSPQGIAKASNEIKKSKRLQVYPHIASYPKTGKKHIDLNGNTAIVYPDGDVVDEDSETQGSNADENLQDAD